MTFWSSCHFHNGGNWESLWETWTCCSGDTLLRHVGKHKQNIRSHAQWENEQLYPVSIRCPHTSTRTRTRTHTTYTENPKTNQAKNPYFKIEVFAYSAVSGFAILHARRLGGVGAPLRYATTLKFDLHHFVARVFIFRRIFIVLSLILFLCLECVRVYVCFRINKLS